MGDTTSLLPRPRRTRRELLTRPVRSRRTEIGGLVTRRRSEGIWSSYGAPVRARISAISCRHGVMPMIFPPMTRQLRKAGITPVSSSLCISSSTLSHSRKSEPMHIWKIGTRCVAVSSAGCFASLPCVAATMSCLPGKILDTVPLGRAARGTARAASGLLKRFGYDLALYYDPHTGTSGRLFVCKGHGGRIDLLCYDKQQRDFVVIEIKNVRAGQRFFCQIPQLHCLGETAYCWEAPCEGLSDQQRLRRAIWCVTQH